MVDEQRSTQAGRVRSRADRMKKITQLSIGEKHRETSLPENRWQAELLRRSRSVWTLLWIPEMISCRVKGVSKVGERKQKDTHTKKRQGRANPDQRVGIVHGQPLGFKASQCTPL